MPGRVGWLLEETASWVWAVVVSGWRNVLGRVGWLGLGQADGLGGPQLARGQRSVARAGHVGIELPVREIVDDTTGRAHDEGAGDKYQNQGRVGTAVAGQPQRPQGRPQQQEGADGPIQSHQSNQGGAGGHQRNGITRWRSVRGSRSSAEQAVR